MTQGSLAGGQWGQEPGPAQPAVLLSSCLGEDRGQEESWRNREETGDRAEEVEQRGWGLGGLGPPEHPLY